MELEKYMKNNGLVVVKEIDYNIAKECTIKNHYSKKWNTSFGKYNFGIFKKNDNRLLGVAVFGNLMNPKSYKSICKNISNNEIIELNRLWVDDELGHNTETVFLSLCFKWFKHNTDIKLVQSFADGRLGCGTIYKASNFKYYGYHESLFFENIKTGEVIHKVPFENTTRLVKMVGENVGYIRGYFKPFTVKTYRYIYFIDKKYENQCLLKQEKYPEYQKGLDYINYNHPSSLIARCLYATKKLGMLDLSKEFLNFMNNNFSKNEIIESAKIAMNNENLNKYLNEKNNEDVVKKINVYVNKYQERVDNCE